MNRRVPLTSPQAFAPVAELPHRVVGARRLERTLGLVLWAVLFVVLFGRF